VSEEIPKWQLAYEDYKNGLKSREIAEKYSVSESTIRSWKSRYWNQKRCNENEKTLQQKAKSVATKKGGQPKNKNATGNNGGAPKANKNNLRHGIYSLLSPDALSEDEKELISSTESLDAIRELEDQVRLCDLLIARHLNKIAELKAGKDVTGTGLSKKVVKVKGKERGQDSNYTLEEIEQSYTYVDEKIDKLNDAIAKHINIKTKCLKTIEDIKLLRSKLSENEKDESLGKLDEIISQTRKLAESRGG